MFSAFNPSKLEQWAADCAAPGEQFGVLVPCSRVSPQSWTLPAGAGIRTHNLGLPRVSSPMLYSLGHDCPMTSLRVRAVPSATDFFFWSNIGLFNLIYKTLTMFYSFLLTIKIVNYFILCKANQVT